MRYLLVLTAMGENLARWLVEAGVPQWDAQTWLNAWDESLAMLAATKPGNYLGYGYTFAGHIRSYRQLLLALQDGQANAQA